MSIIIGRARMIFQAIPSHQRLRSNQRKEKINHYLCIQIIFGFVQSSNGFSKSAFKYMQQFVHFSHWGIYKCSNLHYIPLYYNSFHIFWKLSVLFSVSAAAICIVGLRLSSSRPESIGAQTDRKLPLVVLSSSYNAYFVICAHMLNVECECRYHFYSISFSVGMYSVF